MNTRQLGMTRLPGVLAVLLTAPLLITAPVMAQERVTETGFGPVRLCDSLDAVSVHFPDARDTVFHGPGTSWPGMAISRNDGLVLFITDPADPHRIRRIRSTSSTVAAATGVAPGQLVRTLFERGEEIEIRLPEGEVWLLLRDSGVGVRLDRDSEHSVWERWAPGIEPQTVIPRRATVRAVQTGSRCE